MCNVMHFVRAIRLLIKTWCASLVLFLLSVPSGGAFYGGISKSLFQKV